MNKELDNTLRIKVTGRCNRKCSFCHQEGGMKTIQEVYYNEKLGEIIEFCQNNLGINSIALTGGEPLLYEDLDNLIYQIHINTGIGRFSLTTNGTILKDYDYWRALYQNGLYKVNISISDILESRGILCNECNKDNIFSDQIKTIRILNKIGIIANINIVIFNDALYTANILSALLTLREKGLDFDIVLLPNLIDDKTFEYSEKIIDKIRKEMSLKHINSRRRKGTSNKVEEYISDIGQQVFIKTTKQENKLPFFLPSLCDGCREKKRCQEGFYGMRLEKIEGKFYIRLCIYKSTGDSLMTFDEFINSKIYLELRASWCEYNYNEGV